MVKYTRSRWRPWEVFYKGQFNSAFPSKKKAETDITKSVIRFGDKREDFEIIRRDY